MQLEGYSKKMPDGPAPLSGIKVLVVDDMPDVRLCVTWLLKRRGAMVESADSVIAAIDMIKKFSPTVIVSDLAMPDKTGFDLLRIIRKELEANTLKKTPAIAVSAFAVLHCQAMSMEAGFQAVLNKLVNIDHLSKLVYALAALDGEAVINGFNPSIFL
ncbi:MAG TPA: response regulator [Oligoflexus sp.]|uniref:response regulator n=1 Tax=Oligoflexus sp. TaxID=1971216 RepID=UPI002D6CE492|nr:response regulator [Oligoflexus sp.]HYX36607.1 response regulator [Oligoflexus sp.]